MIMNISISKITHTLQSLKLQHGKTIDRYFKQFSNFNSSRLKPHIINGNLLFLPSISLFRLDDGNFLISLVKITQPSYLINFYFSTQEFLKPIYLTKGVVNFISVFSPSIFANIVNNKRKVSEIDCEKLLYRLCRIILEFSFNITHIYQKLNHDYGKSGKGDKTRLRF